MGGDIDQIFKSGTGKLFKVGNFRSWLWLEWFDPILVEKLSLVRR